MNLKVVVINFGESIGKGFSITLKRMNYNLHTPHSYTMLTETEEATKIIPRVWLRLIGRLIHELAVLGGYRP